MRRLALLLVATPTLFLAGPAPAQAGEPVLDAPDQDPLISNGTPTQTCQFPTTVMMSSNGSLCTGTLIHPQIVTFAAHCSYVSTVYFGESFNNIYRQASVDFCLRNPEWDPNLNNGVNGNDYAFCKLDNPVTDIPITPPVYGCELDMLRPNEPAVIAGFGNNNGDNGAGTKRWAETIIQTPVLPDSDTVAVGQVGTAACSGDSGGPAYFRYPDGSWHTFGTVSGGPPCGSGADTYTLINRAVPFIEANSGIDVTPCHDVDGTWNPGPDCGGFATNISQANLSPAQGCSNQVSAMLATCGPAYGAPPDVTPPVVTIDDPVDGSQLEVGASVDILVSAEDPDFGVERVRLFIDGQEVATDEYAPWEFANASFPAGTYELVAQAEDYSGNTADSAPVTIVVGDGPVPDPDTGDGDGDGDAGADSGDGGTGDGGSGGDGSGGLDTDGFPDDPSLDGEDGCACSSAEPGGPAGALGLGLLVLLGLRRRRD